VIAGLEVVALETAAVQNWNGGVAIERRVLVCACTAKEDDTPLGSLFEHEPATRTESDAFAQWN
jgi:hypothetical protein